jgi:ubiE/COQ5 methyltransferase family
VSTYAGAQQTNIVAQRAPAAASRVDAHHGQCEPSPINASRFNTAADDVFGRIASRYDLLFVLFSLWIHRSWKRRVAALIASEPWSRLFDAASGTGDIVLRVLSQQSATP